jgi:septum formation protein
MHLDQIERIKRHFSKVILASKSQRRFEIFNVMGLAPGLGPNNFLIIPSNFQENLDKAAYPSAKDYCLATAMGKALRLEADLYVAGELDLIVSADSIVVLNDIIFEKPKTKAEARSMLRQLSGKKHVVYSAVSLRYLGHDNERTGRSFVEGTTVEFSELSDELIDAYVETEEPMDKAGGYGIQGMGGAFVKGIEGCFYNVMGFPMNKFGMVLKEVMDELDAAGPRPKRKTALQMLEQLELDDTTYKKHMENIMEEWKKDLLAMDILSQEQMDSLDTDKPLSENMIRKLKMNLESMTKNLEELTADGGMDSFNDETFKRLQKQFGVDDFSQADFNKIKQSAGGMSFAELQVNLNKAMKEHNVSLDNPLKTSIDEGEDQSHPFQKFMKEQNRILGELDKLKKTGVDINNLQGEFDKTKSRIKEMTESDKFKEMFEGIPPPPAAEATNPPAEADGGGPDITVMGDNESKKGV